MGTKMKGLLKGLRYISQIFEDNKEEEEMQIGYPTDVKHVAHIGWDGNSSSSPSWMGEYRPGTANGGDAPVGLQQLAAGAIAGNGDSEVAPRQSRRSASNASDPGDHVASSPNREARSSGRHQPTNGTADPLAAQEQPTSEPSRHVRRHRSNAGSVVGDGEAAAGKRDPSTDAAKQARRRRSKAASSAAAAAGGAEAKGSTRSTSRLKHQASAAEMGSEEQITEQPQSAAKVAVGDGVEREPKDN